MKNPVYFHLAVKDAASCVRLWEHFHLNRFLNATQLENSSSALLPIKGENTRCERFTHIRQTNNTRTECAFTESLRLPISLLWWASSAILYFVKSPSWQHTEPTTSSRAKMFSSNTKTRSTSFGQSTEPLLPCLVFCEYASHLNYYYCYERRTRASLLVKHAIQQYRRRVTRHTTIKCKW